MSVWILWAVFAYGFIFGATLAIAREFGGFVGFLAGVVLLGPCQVFFLYAVYRGALEMGVFA